MKNQRQKWIWALMGVGAFIGTILGQIIMYIIKGEFNFYATLASLSGVLILIVINIIIVYLKKDKTPEIDERTISNMLKYIAYSSNIFLGLLLTALAVLSLIGVKDIAIKYLWITMFSYLWIVGIGGIIIRCR